MRISRLIPVTATGLLAVGLTACSGDDDGGSSGSSTVEAAAVSSDLGSSTPLADHDYVDAGQPITGTMDEGAGPAITGAGVTVSVADTHRSDGELCTTVTTHLTSPPTEITDDPDVEAYLDTHLEAVLGWLTPVIDVHAVDGDQVADAGAPIGRRAGDRVVDAGARTITETYCGKELTGAAQVVLTLDGPGLAAERDGWLAKL